VTALTTNDVMTLIRDHTRVRAGNLLVCVCGETGFLTGAEHTGHVAEMIADATTGPAPAKEACRRLPAGELHSGYLGARIRVDDADGHTVDGTLGALRYDPPPSSLVSVSAITDTGIRTVHLPRPTWVELWP
jgi:hypothetical protein